MDNLNIPSNPIDEAIILIDRLLPYYPDFDDDFHYSTIHWSDESNWTEKDKTSLYNNHERIKKILLKLGYAAEDEYGGHFALTDKGRDAKKVGGHFAYIQQLSDKAAKEAERQKLNDEKLNFDVKNSKRIFKTYWWTFAFALVSFVYVLIQILLKIFEK